MGPVGYMIAILGCADGGSSCQVAATLAPRYESASQCRAARESALDANTDLDFPTLIAECRSTITPAGSRPRPAVEGVATAP